MVLAFSFMAYTSIAADINLKINEDAKEETFEALKLEYERAINLREENKNTLIHNLVKNNNPLSWSSLIIYGFKQDNFTALDMAWIIDEHASPYYLTKKEAMQLFKIMILDSQVMERAKRVKELLLEVSIPKSGYLDGKISSAINASSMEEKSNVLAYCVEKAYQEILNIILNSYPEFIWDISKQVAVSRQERKEVVQPGWFSNSYSYEIVEYTLPGWMIRKPQGSEEPYLWARINYTNAAKLLAAKVMSIIDEEHQSVSKLLFEMMSLLYKKNNFDFETLFEAGLRLPKGQ